MKTLPLFFIFIVCGCIKTVDKESYSLLLSDSDKEILNKECHELAQIGNIADYFKIIDIENDIVIKLIEEYDGDSKYHKKIIFHSDKIFDAIKRIEILTDGKYNIPLWDYEVKWKITKDDFKKFLGNYIPNGFEMTWIRPHSASIFGEREDELLDNISFRFGKKTANFTYKNKGTTLEVCQLGKTRMLLMEVHYKHLGKNNKRYFNLINR